MKKQIHITALIFATLLNLANETSVANASEKREWTLDPIDNRANIPNKFPLCHELLSLLNDSANKDYILQWKKGDVALVIPKSFKNFRLPIWKDVPKDQWGEILSKKDQKSMTPAGGIQTTQMDVDHDGKADKILRFWIGDPQSSWRTPRCRVALDSLKYLKAFNTEGGNNTDACFMLYYKGRAYQKAGTAFIIVYEGSQTRTIDGLHFYASPVCSFTPPKTYFQKSTK